MLCAEVGSNITGADLPVIGVMHFKKTNPVDLWTLQIQPLFFVFVWSNSYVRLENSCKI